MKNGTRVLLPDGRTGTIESNSDQQKVVVIVDPEIGPLMTPDGEAWEDLDGAEFIVKIPPERIIIERSFLQVIPTTMEQLDGLSEAFDRIVPERGFLGMVFIPGQQGLINYVTNIDHEDLVEVLEEFLADLKNGQDFQAVQ